MSGQHWENYDVKREIVHYVDRCCMWPDVVDGISARFSKFAFVLFRYITNSSRETLRFEVNKIHCSPRDQSLSVDCLHDRRSLVCPRKRG